MSDYHICQLSLGEQCLPFGKPAKPKPRPCFDCVDFHGEDAGEWLAETPDGALFSECFGVHLCDGCL